MAEMLRKNPTRKVRDTWTTAIGHIQARVRSNEHKVAIDISFGRRGKRENRQIATLQSFELAHMEYYATSHCRDCSQVIPQFHSHRRSVSLRVWRTIVPRLRPRGVGAAVTFAPHVRATRVLLLLTSAPYRHPHWRKVNRQQQETSSLSEFPGRFRSMILLAAFSAAEQPTILHQMNTHRIRQTSDKVEMISKFFSSH